MVGQVATILVVQYGLGIALPLQPMFAVLAALVLFNLASLGAGYVAPRMLRLPHAQALAIALVLLGVSNLLQARALRYKGATA